MTDADVSRVTSAVEEICPVTCGRS